MAGAGIMEIGYAIQVKPKDDPFIRYAESGLECFNAAAVGGTFLVDVLPICELVVASPIFRATLKLCVAQCDTYLRGSRVRGFSGRRRGGARRR